MTIKLAIDDDRLLPGMSEIARSSQAGIEMLARYSRVRIDELWLDHDLGGTDTILPVCEVLEETAFNGVPYDIGIILVHSANPVGANTVVNALLRQGYNARRVPTPACGTIKLPQ